MIEKPNLRYPTKEKVPVSFRCLVHVELGKFSLKLPMFVVDMQEDCILGLDFFKETKLKNENELLTTLLNDLLECWRGVDLWSSQ